MSRFGLRALIVAVAMVVVPFVAATPSQAALPNMSLCSAGSPTVPCVQSITVLHSGTTTDIFAHSTNTWDEAWPGSGLWNLMSGVHSSYFVTGDTISASFDMGPTSDPSISQYYSMYTAGNGQSFTVDTSGSRVIVSYSVTAADVSWMNDGNVCNVISCADNLVADYDSTAMITQIMPLDGSGKPTAYNGSWMSSNAQSTRLFWESDQFGFQAASPHFKHSPSTTVAGGFFKIFLPRTALAEVFSAPDVVAATFSDLLRLGDTVGGVGSDLTSNATITDVGSGILIDYPNMHYSAHDITVTRSVVTWSPTNTSITGSSGSITPSPLATTNSDGAITYAVASAGTTGCSIDSSTGVIAYGAPGTCQVTATSAATATFAASSKEATFVFTAPAPSGGSSGAGSSTQTVPAPTATASPPGSSDGSGTSVPAPSAANGDTAVLTGNPLVGYRPATSIAVLSAAAAEIVRPMRISSPLSDSLRGASSISLTPNQPIALRIGGLPPSQPLKVRLKVGGRYVSLPNTWVNEAGTTTLPAFRIKKSGTYVVALIDPAASDTKYVKLRVKRPRA